MNWAKMRASAADNFSNYDSGAIFLQAFLSRTSIDIMMMLKVAALAVDVSIVARRVASKINSLGENFFEGSIENLHPWFRNIFRL